jgi:DNA-binding transcriptional ArsR family regulator
LARFPLRSNSIRWQRNSGKEASAPKPRGLFLHPDTVTRQNHYLLAQSERSVEDLARETDLSIANASQHLRKVKQGR